MEIFYIWTDHEYSMNFKPKTFCTFVLSAFGLFSIVEINLYQYRMQQSVSIVLMRTIIYTKQRNQ